ncbi:hypothetical protein [Streptosporangium sp. KLBMP 9127]|nr:hypothetical protein [Streptosporangium sp. KLBMP 9127]
MTSTSRLYVWRLPSARADRYRRAMSELGGRGLGFPVEETSGSELAEGVEF